MPDEKKPDTPLQRPRTVTIEDVAKLVDEMEREDKQPKAPHLRVVPKPDS